jgi:hypothetical protein
MTEKEVLEMEAEVGKTTIEPGFQNAWIDEQLEGLRAQEKRTVLLWKFHKLMRNDEPMTKAFDELKKTREAIAVLTEQRT